MNFSEEKLYSEDMDLENEEDDQNSESTESALQTKIYLRNISVCKKQISSVAYANLFWIFFILCLIVFFASCIYNEWIKYNPSEWSQDSKSPIAVVIGGLLSLLSIFRIIGNLGLKKRFGPFRKEYSDQMPDEPNPVLRDLYITLHCKRYIHFWLTFLFQFLAILSFLYTLIGSGIYWAIKSTKPKLFELSASSFTKAPEDWSTWIALISVSCVFLFCIQYVFMNWSIKRGIKAMEDVYGKERLVNDCLLSYKIHEVNKKYKTFVFVVVCTLGCIIYIFFKKMICIMFDKSFST